MMMTELHRRLVAVCFEEAFGGERRTDGMSDGELAGLLRLQARVAGNFGLYVLAAPDTEVEPPLLSELAVHTAAELLARMGRCHGLSQRAPMACALSEIGGTGGSWASEMVRFVGDAAASEDTSEIVTQAAVRAFGALQPWLSKSGLAAPRVAAMKRYVMSVVGRWVATMNPDGTWADVSDDDATARAALLADTAIPGMRVGAEQIDRCYLRYVVGPADDAPLPLDLRRMEARCVHYTDIETEYAGRDITILSNALECEPAAGVRADVCAMLFNVVLQLYWAEAEPYGLMSPEMRGLYNRVLASGTSGSLTDDELMAVAEAAAGVSGELCGEAYDEVFVDGLAISSRFMEICDELTRRAVRPDIEARERQHMLQLAGEIGYGSAGADPRHGPADTACPRA